ncbi:hypothetical protein SERLA73DRAFT_111680 [Serpula lacrymans var. lacrymans S7.3]|uniref:pyridoxal kinase n=2 Tax=Serpula lacrymans var. lacrymans TaxID=341189 RepID=F8Q443_SERL3|nr:uncharacterized protein SERLADRAFT_416947 [Serpula lacrymans var. lacrymans S7.9]EGN96899.1 hypothetical protein SERLA73DRAFT_111680 [Serpula lacrymans var. lacrymans S7.3]EGO22497.1 hypothetical protein SERLADRAFT_416947 [Serpula lacrymans var. lacrymans S7.9]
MNGSANNHVDFTTVKNSRILSIQSHVAFGYVGGKAAVFPLQCLGYDVDAVNTVNFSNHAGYGRFGGSKTTADELSAMFESMEQNGLLLPSRLLTGYIPEAKALTAVSELATKLKRDSPDIIYLLDPVIGDSGRMYVSSDVVPVYRSMLPLASVITPNWFEVEVLTGVELHDLPSLQRALRILHQDYHVPHVVISSIPLKQWLLDVLPPNIKPSPSATEDSEFLLCISSSADGNGSQNLSTVHARSVPLIPGYFSGVGDLFSALLLGHFHPKQDPPSPHDTTLSYAASSALTKTHSILQITHEYALLLPEDERTPTDEEKDKAEPVRKFRRMRGRELRLIQGQDILRSTAIDELKQMKPWVDFWSTTA